MKGAPTILVLIFAALLTALGIFAQTPAGDNRLFHDVDGIFTDWFNSKMDQQLRDFEKLTPGRIVVFALKDSPPGGEDAFIAETTARLQRTDARLADGLIFFYFRENRRAHTESGHALLSRLPNADIQKILKWSLTGSSADILYPDAIRKALTAISFLMRDALDRPAPGAGAFERVRHAARHIYFTYRASSLASGDWVLAPVLAGLFLLIGIGILIGQIRMVSQTIASGKKMHLTRGRIAAKVAEQLAVEGVEVAANVAFSAAGSAIGGSSGGGYSGGGGSFGGGGASGSW